MTVFSSVIFLLSSTYTYTYTYTCTYLAFLAVTVVGLPQDTCEDPVDTIKRKNTFELLLAEDYEALDPTLPRSIAEIKKRGGHRCWHKHNTFLDHLLGVHNILRLWGECEVSARVGLFHSAYSNSYVNLALFDPHSGHERKVMRNLIGVDAEEMVHLFCIIDRQSVVVDTLLKNGVIPPDGLHVPHLRDERIQIHLHAETLRLLVVFTMADVSDQYFGWQDDLFGGNNNGKPRWENSMLLPGQDDASQHDPQALWPGPSRPGLWMSYVSQLGRVARTYQLPQTEDGTGTTAEDGVLSVPPVFNDCSEILSREDEAAAIELYWDVMIHSDSMSTQDVIEKLHKSIEFNPWFFESHVLLAQTYLHLGNHTNARDCSERALQLQKEWGTAYDKRMNFNAWVAWTRVLHARSIKEEGWPTNSWDVNNFGMVQ